MEIIIKQYWHHGRYGREITKTFESDIVPPIGALIEDSLFKDPNECKVVDVTINYTENTCYVDLESCDYSALDQKQWEQMLHVAELHEWSYAKLGE